MFDGMEDYNLDGSEKKNYGCLIISTISIVLILFGIFVGWLIF
jgi:hypothetical protein